MHVHVHVSDDGCASVRDITLWKGLELILLSGLECSVFRPCSGSTNWTCLDPDSWWYMPDRFTESKPGASPWTSELHMYTDALTYHFKVQSPPLPLPPSLPPSLPSLPLSLPPSLPPIQDGNVIDPGQQTALMSRVKRNSQPLKSSTSQCSFSLIIFIIRALS